jgi:predicted nucleotidyltransferase
MERPNIRVPTDEVAAFCRRHHIRRLSLFGSVLRDDFAPDSDVDVLYEFQPGYGAGLAIIQIEQELARILAVARVDLVNAKYLNPRLRDRILGSAEVQYAEG